MDTQIATQSNIETKILVLRKQQVMIDRDLAELYGVETKVLNQAVKRNLERFPDNFMFKLNDNEKNELVTNCDRFATLKHSSSTPYAFTEQGVAMLSAVLKSERAVATSIQIMNAFVSMRHFLQNNSFLLQEMISIRQHQNDADKKIEQLFEMMDKYKVNNTQGIFYQGQIFDAYAKFESFICQAKNEIILIDNYVDLSVLEQLAKKATGVNVTIYTPQNTKLTPQDIQKFNAQYPFLKVNYTAKVHDRFLIIDNTMLYHIGASLKDLGKKCFAFEVLDSSFIPDILKNI